MGGRPKSKPRAAPPPLLPEVDGGPWPESVRFLGDYLWASDVTADLCSKYRGDQSRQAPPCTPSPCTVVSVKRISDASHPAFGEFGLFARTDLVVGQLIIDYLGVVSVAEDRSSD
jgi:hypothetical protein